MHSGRLMVNSRVLRYLPLAYAKRESNRSSPDTRETLDALARLWRDHVRGRRRSEIAERPCTTPVGPLEERWGRRTGQ
jgi:hypothetical protein